MAGSVKAAASGRAIQKRFFIGKSSENESLIECRGCRCGLVDPGSAALEGTPRLRSTALVITSHAIVDPKVNPAVSVICGRPVAGRVGRNGCGAAKNAGRVSFNSASMSERVKN